MAFLSDTIAALATPVGVSALAVVRVSGPASASLARDIFGRELTARMAVHADYRARSGVLLDDVVAVFFAGPHSYTGEDALEISCHGNPLIAQKIVEDLLARECRPAEPGEFTRRAFANGRLDLSQAEAVMDLIGARSERALAAAQQQLRGSLGRHLNVLIQELLGALARVEAYIDFPDEDLPPEDRSIVGDALDRLLAGTRRLLATQHYGEILRDGLKTVIVGEPNAGKSSLLNRLVGRDRALVSPEPGTTRDFIEERILVGPHSLRLIDTAGLNPSPAPLEKLGIEKTFERAAEADLLMVVLDLTRPRPSFPPELLRLLAEKKTVWVGNKADLASQGNQLDADDQEDVICVSALSGFGIDRLIAEITERAESIRQDNGPEVIAINARHADALRRAGESLDEAKAKLERAGPVELLASDLREALSSFGEIGGKIDNERMLDQLFATFCIGK